MIDLILMNRSINVNKKEHCDSASYWGFRIQQKMRQKWPSLKSEPLIVINIYHLS